MEKILPQYEVLVNDLAKLEFDKYLVSREFKIFMTEKDLFDQWKAQYNVTVSNRRYFSVGTNYERIDSFNTFKTYLNLLPAKK